MRKTPDDKERLSRDQQPLPPSVRKRKAPKPQETQEERPTPDPLANFLSQVWPFVAKNALHIALAAGLIIVAFMTYRILALRQASRTVTQWESISNLPEIASMMYAREGFQTARDLSVQQCRAILDAKPSKTVAPYVMLKLADLYTYGDEWAAAVDTYKRLIAEYPATPAAEWAKSALAVALEQTGKYAEAAELYESLAQAGRPLYLADAGRCRELSGDVPGAEADYRKLRESKVSDAVTKAVDERLLALAQGKVLTAPPQLELPRRPAILPTPEVAPTPEAAPAAAPKPEAAPTPEAGAPEAPKPEAAPEAKPEAKGPEAGQPKTP